MLTRIVPCSMLLLFAVSLHAEDVAPATAPAAARTFTVAVLPFSAGSTESEAALGGQMAELVAIGLSGRPGLTLVERAALGKVLDEQAIGRSGLVDADQAVKVGKLVGARILVTGKVFTADDQTLMSAKIIGVETSRVEAVMEKATGKADLPAMAVKLAEQVAQRIAASGKELVGADGTEFDPIPALKKRLAGRSLPTLAIIVPERHVSGAPPVPDPAVETELKSVLIDAGFRVQDVRDNELADFARRLPEQSPESWPRSLAGVDVVIVGEGLSEMGARIGNFVTCSARAEINVIERTSGKIVLAERSTQRAADLSENLAAKSALASAGRELAIDVLEHFAGPAAGAAKGDHAP